MYIIYFADKDLKRSTITIHTNCDLAVNMAKEFRAYNTSDHYICVDKISGDPIRVPDTNIYFEQCNGQ